MLAGPLCFVRATKARAKQAGKLKTGQLSRHADGLLAGEHEDSDMSQSHSRHDRQ